MAGGPVITKGASQAPKNKAGKIGRAGGPVIVKGGSKKSKDSDKLAKSVAKTGSAKTRPTKKKPTRPGKSKRRKR